MNLDGPVRVADTAGSGSATITLSFDNWKGGNVAPTTHSVVVAAAKPGPVAEAVTSALAGTLVHPDRKASVWGVKFSADGKRLFTAGYPSGVVQIWDVGSRKELRRIDSPRGYRGSADYAQLSPDWKTLYVPVETRKVVRGEKDGKPFVRLEHGGEVRVWDAATGDEKTPLKPAAGHSASYAKLSPDGRFLAVVERPSQDAEDRTVQPATVLVNTATGGRRKLCDGYAYPEFSPDGGRVAVVVYDTAGQSSTLHVFDTATGREVGKLAGPDKDRGLLVNGFSPDGAVLAISVRGKKGTAAEVWFRDAATLADRGTFVGEARPDQFPTGNGRFTPDGSRFVVLEGPRVSVWDVAAKKVVRTADTGADGWHSAVSADGATLAVAWMPKSDSTEREPDPADLPQPRVTLIDLAGKAAPRTLVCPHGYAGGLAFSPDGKTLAFGSAGGVHLLDVR